MTLESLAGRFIPSFDTMEPGEGEIVISGMRMTLRPRVLGFLVRARLGLSRVKASQAG